MNLPDKAVEAATRAFRETHDMGDALMNALNAAAPSLMSQAWEEGWQEGWPMDYEPDFKRNPYRSEQ